MLVEQCFDVSNTLQETQAFWDSAKTQSFVETDGLLVDRVHYHIPDGHRPGRLDDATHRVRNERRAQALPVQPDR